jgi:serine/threonine protein kinase
MKPKLTRQVLKNIPRIPIHESRNWSKADVYAIEWPQGSGQKVVVKDLKNKPLWFRISIGRAFLAREWKALQALQGLEGITKTVGRPDADAFVIEFCEGRKAVHFPRRSLGADVINRAENILQAAHARGVTHGDLHNDNILVHDDGSVTLIDWATAICFGAKPSGLKAFTFSEWRAIDERSIAKLKITHMPEAITASEREQLLRGGSKLYRNVKKVRGWFQRLRGQDNEAALRAQKKFHYRAKKYYNSEPELLEQELESPVAVSSSDAASNS